MVAKPYVSKIITLENNVKMNILYDDPKIFTIDNYLTNEECDHFINLSKNKLKRSLVSIANKGSISEGRTGENCWIMHNNDKITKSVSEKIAKLVEIPIENAESFQLIHYDKTQQYRQHYDGWDHNNSDKTLRCLKYGGQRLVTVLCYLNDVKEGGGTKFTKLNKEVEAKKGKLLFFRNVEEGSNIKHKLSEHAGMPVIEGEKFAFNLWFRECSVKKLYKDFNPDYYN